MDAHSKIPQADPSHPKYNPLYDPATDNLPIDPVVQTEIINKPSEKPHGMSSDDQQFWSLILDKISKGEINLFIPTSLIDQSVYNTLDEKDQGRVDQNAYNLLSVIRKLKALYDTGYGQTYQFENLVNQIRLTKERLEKDYGNVFII